MTVASQINEYMMWMFLSPNNCRYTAETKQFVEKWKVYKTPYSMHKIPSLNHMTCRHDNLNLLTWHSILVTKCVDERLKCS
jgi:hypothetical protein